jgi:RNA polymerase sigma-70 factor (ECF subfamily)
VDDQYARTAAQSDFTFIEDESGDDLPAPPIDRRQRDRLIELIGLHRAALLKYVKRMLVSAEDAEDIVQESCIRLLRVRDLWRSERAVLFKIATNLARDEMRRRKTRRHGHHQPYETLELVAEQEQVEEILDHDIARQIISQTLLRLPSRYREVFNLHVEGHLSYRAIARRLGVSTKTVERDMSGVHELCMDRFDMRRAACA